MGDGRRIISFAIWGNNPLYLNGAVRNSVDYPKMFPGWKCRYYYDRSIPEDVINELSSNGAELVEYEPTYGKLGMYWRMHVVYDTPGLDRAIVRDTDMIPTTREKAAVDEWIESGKPFHCMRDKEVHTTSILGGMWGVVGGYIKDMETRLKVWFQQLHPEAVHPLKSQRRDVDDQLFLHHMIWPIVKDDYLGHYRAGMDHLKYTTNDKPFPIPFDPNSPEGFIGEPR